MIKLHIKGPVKTAKRAAARHGIPATKCRVLPSSLGGLKNVLCEAPCSAGTNVRRWYGEHARVKAGRGLPPGTLTFFHEACGSGLGGARRKKRRR